MTLNVIVLLIVVGTFGLFIGFGVACKIFEPRIPKIEGELIVMRDKDDSDRPYLYLNINKHPDKLQEGQTAVFVVKRKDM